MGIYEKNGRWYVRFKHNKKLIHRALPLATSKKEAENSEIRIKSDLLQGKLDLLESVGDYSFSKACKEFEKFAEINRKSWKKSEVFIFSRLVESFSNLQLKEITPFLLEKYRLSRKKEDIKPATINREMDVLSAILRYSVSQGYLKENPVLKIKKLKVQNNIERFLTPEEEKTLYSYLPEYIKPVITVLLHTACRKNEILRLKWSSVNLKKRVITLYDTKNGHVRHIPMSNAVHSIISSIKQDNEYVFVNTKTGKPFSDICRPFKKACDAAKIAHTRVHDIRHTSATRMSASGVDLVTVANLLGHSDIRVTAQRYSHATPENKKRAISALENFKEQG